MRVDCAPMDEYEIIDYQMIYYNYLLHKFGFKEAISMVYKINLKKENENV